MEVGEHVKGATVQERGKSSALTIGMKQIVRTGMIERSMGVLGRGVLGKHVKTSALVPFAATTLGSMEIVPSFLGSFPSVLRYWEVVESYFQKRGR